VHDVFFAEGHGEHEQTEESVVCSDGDDEQFLRIIMVKLP